LPVPPLVDVTCTELFLTPGEVPVTLTIMMQVVTPNGIVAPLILTLVAPGFAVNVGEIGPQPAMPSELTTRPAGKLSVKPTPVNEVPVFGLLTVRVRLVPPFSGIVAAPNDFLIEGGVARTITLAVAVLPVPPLVDVTVTELFLTPGEVPVTLRLIRHPVSAPMSVPPLKLTLLPPGAAVTVLPVQGLTSPFGVLTTRPAGKLSVKPIPVNEVLGSGFGFLMVMIRLVLPFSGMMSGKKSLAITGGKVWALIVRGSQRKDNINAAKRRITILLRT
jgi:hypothetical protein